MAVPAVAYFVAFAIAQSSPTLSLVIYAALPVMYFAAVTALRSTAPADAVEADFT